ncbi:MAG: thioredoxin fold domain-containing protein [Spirochaetes bacterium]|nr:thioredoxin fold domain-containing protein [Spirochaetota bacterium]
MKRMYTLGIILALSWMVGSCGKSEEQEGAAKGARVAAPAASVAWLGVNEGLKRGRETGRPIVLNFYADWCGWCRKMDTEVYGDRDVVSALEKGYVPVQVRTDRDAGEVIRFKNHTVTLREFAMMLGVQGLPTVIFLESNGDIITKIPGYIEKPMFLSLLGYIGEKCYAMNVSFEEYSRGGAPCGRGK